MNLRAAIKKIIKKKQVKPKLKINRDDTFLVSFPKSGNTWMRFLLINSLFNKKRQKLKFDDLESFIPSIYKTDLNEINKRRRPRIVKSHEVKSEYPNIIYIVRDGRDSIVSYYYYLRDLKGLKGSFREFYYSEKGKGVGMWHQHVQSALDYQKLRPENIIITKYEDLKINPIGELKKIFTFLNKSVDDNQLEFAIESSSFEKLKDMQTNSGVIVENKKIDFFRKGSSNQWKEYFDEDMLNDFVENSADLMKKLGYHI